MKKNRIILVSVIAVVSIWLLVGMTTWTSRTNSEANTPLSVVELLDLGEKYLL